MAYKVAGNSQYTARELRPNFNFIYTAVHGTSMYTLHLHLHRITSKLLLDRYHAQLVEDDDLFFSVSRVCSRQRLGDAGVDWPF